MSRAGRNAFWSSTVVKNIKSNHRETKHDKGQKIFLRKYTYPAVICSSSHTLDYRRVLQSTAFGPHYYQVQYCTRTIL